MPQFITDFLNQYPGIGFALGLGSMFTIMACASIIIRSRP